MGLQKLNTSLEKKHVHEVPPFRDFRFQRVILKCGDHEFPGLL